MSRKKIYKPEEIVAKLRQVEILTSQGKSAADAIQSLGMTHATYYRWRQAYRHLGVTTAVHDRRRRAKKNTAPAVHPGKNATSIIEFDTLAEAVPQIVWITGADGMNIYFNQQWEDYTGLTVEEGHGHGWNIPFHPDDRQRAWEAWQHAWQTDGVYSLECRLRRADGIYRWWLIRGRALHNEDGKIINWYGTWTDVEDIKQTEDELKRARDVAEAANQKLQQAYDEIRELYEKTKALNQFKTQMFANVSHELRTPLTLILAPLESLLSMRLPKGATERLKLAQRNARGLLKQINDLLDVARLEAGKTTVTYYETDLAKLIKHIASSFDNPAKERHVRFSVMTPSPMTVQIDIEKFERILVNLLSNAFKFTPEGGQIRCQLYENSGPFAVIDVADSGPGIPDAFRNSIFEQFFQIPGSTRFGGTGLGLSIVKNFVEIQHGRVTVGKSPEGGALFTIGIPIKAPEGIPVIRRPDEVFATPSFVAESLPPLHRKKWEPTKPLEPAVGFYEPKPRKPMVLVVEDNPDMRDYICDTLGPDVELETAENGREGLEKIQTLLPDLVISDIMMPEMGGDEMVRKIRATRELEAIPFIFVTAKADEELRIELLREGAIDYLIKPFMPEELRSKAKNSLAVKASEAKYRELMESAQVDVGVVVKASQAVSGEIELDKLIEMLLRIAIEHARAERGLLILLRDNKPWIEAEARSDKGRVEVTLQQAAVTPSALPQSVLNYVIQTRESVILDDTAAPTQFSADAYVQHQRPRCVLCLPLVKQAKLVGTLYLENNLTPRVFTADRIAVLEVLASQAAISLENALLYAKLQQENSDRERAEEALRDRDAGIRRLVDSNIIGIIFATLSGGISDTNDAFLQMLGYSRADVQSGKIQWTKLTPPEHQAFSARAVEELRRTGSCTPFEKDYIAKDGRRVPVLVGAVSLADSQENTIAFVLDLSERKQAEAERAARRTAEAANQAKNAFLATMSHELRTPLNGILGYAQILQRNKTLGEREIDGLNIIQQSGEQLLTLINDILDFARIEAGKLEISVADFALAQFLRLIAEIINVRARQKGLKFICDMTPDLPSGIRADASRLRQVLLNLLTNAVKFTDRGQVSLRVRFSPPGRLRFEIQDTGIGVSAGDLDVIFQPFEQVSDPQRRFGGAGLGLAISRQFVRLMGGDIHVTSEVGVGSTFWFELDVPVIETVAEVPELIVTGYEGPRKKVLVVDDVASNRAMAVDMLNQLGFDVIEAANGHEALEKAQTLGPDWILMDVIMPEMDGLEATRRLRQLPGLEDVPIIAMSASAFGSDEQKCLAAGVNAFSPKPIDLEQLLPQIATVLKLNWIYAPQAASVAQEAAAGPSVVPPRQELERLHHLARLGNMRDIVQWAERVAQLDERYGPFVEQLRLMAKGFQSKAILSLVEHYLDR